jgi:hypothetical protein
MAFAPNPAFCRLTEGGHRRIAGNCALRLLQEAFGPLDETLDGLAPFASGFLPMEFNT